MRWVLVVSAAALVLAAYYCAAEETPTAQFGDESRRNVVWRSNDRSPLNQLRYVFEHRGRLYMVSEAPAGCHYTYASGGIGTIDATGTLQTLPCDAQLLGMFGMPCHMAKQRYPKCVATYSWPE
jgi:hypothetical protein